jgi:hypothetical protein
MGRREFLILQWWTLLGGSHETCEVVCSEAGDGCIEGGAFRHYSNSLSSACRQILIPDSHSGGPGLSPLLSSPLLFPSSSRLCDSELREWPNSSLLFFIG